MTDSADLGSTIEASPSASGGIDDVPSKRVQEFEKNYHLYMAEKHQAVLDEIRTTKAVSDGIEQGSGQAITYFIA